jgi:hypothetical protein
MSFGFTVGLCRLGRMQPLLAQNLDGASLELDATEKQQGANNA